MDHLSQSDIIFHHLAYSRYVPLPCRETNANSLSCDAIKTNLLAQERMRRYKVKSYCKLERLPLKCYTNFVTCTKYSHRLRFTIPGGLIKGKTLQDGILSGKRGGLWKNRKQNVQRDCRMLMNRELLASSYRKQNQTTTSSYLQAIKANKILTHWGWTDIRYLGKSIANTQSFHKTTPGVQFSTPYLKR